MSTGKKVFLVMISIILVIAMGIAGYAAKFYWDVKNTATEMHQSVGASHSGKKDTTIDEKKPFSVLLLGIDTGDLGRDEQGRSDTMMVATVNPTKQETEIVSLGRDTYTEIAGSGVKDKLNHAYAFGGVEMAVQTVEKLVDVPVNHYVSINMKGLQDLVEAIDGIDIDNTLVFSQDGYDFGKGTIHLTGKSALAYSRMRYEDPKGDYGRQDRQRKIVAAIVKKTLNVSNLTKYPAILKVLEQNMKTDLSWEDMLAISKDYRGAFGKIEQDQLHGEGVMRDGISYQDIPQEELLRVQTVLKGQLN